MYLLLLHYLLLYFVYHVLHFLDLQTLSKLQTVIVYPIMLADMYSDDIKKYTEQAAGIQLELDEMFPGKPLKGFVFRFHCHL